MGPKSTELLNVIESRMDSFTKSQRKIAVFIKENLDKAAFYTAAAMSNGIGVSESTIVRFAMELGYEGYPEMQKAIRELIKNKLTAAQRLEVASDRMDEKNLLRSVLAADSRNIKETLGMINNEDFDNAVDLILAAKTIYILGVRSSSALAGFMGFYFNLIFDNVRLVNTTSASEIFEQMINVSTEDVVIGISFPRYSKRTAKAMQFAKDNGAKVIAITDSYHSPVSRHADLALLAKSDMTSFVDSLTAPLSVITALVVALGMKRKETVHRTLQHLEKIWDEYDVYERIEDKHTYAKTKWEIEEVEDL